MSPDRFGDPIDEDEPQQPLHDPRCDGHGWIDRDAVPAVACTDCKPWLKDQIRRRPLLDADQLRAEPQPTKEPNDE